MTTLGDIVGNAAVKYGQDPAYLARVARVESTNNPNADNGTAKGLFQFVPGTAKAYGLANPFDPAASSDAAARLTRDDAHYLGSSSAAPTAPSSFRASAGGRRGGRAARQPECSGGLHRGPEGHNGERGPGRHGGWAVHSALGQQVRRRPAARLERAGPGADVEHADRLHTGRPGGQPNPELSQIAGLNLPPAAPVLPAAAFATASHRFRTCSGVPHTGRSRPPFRPKRPRCSRPSNRCRRSSSLRRRPRRIQS